MDNMNNKDDVTNGGSTTPSSKYKNEHEYTHTNDTEEGNLKGMLYSLKLKKKFHYYMEDKGFQY